MDFLEQPNNTYLSALPDDLLNCLKLYYILMYPIIYSRGTYDVDQCYQALDGKWHIVLGHMWEGYDHICVVQNHNYNFYRDYIAQLALKKDSQAHYYIFIANNFKLTFYINNPLDNRTIYQKIISFIINNPIYYSDVVYLIDNKSHVYMIDDWS